MIALAEPEAGLQLQQSGSTSVTHRSVLVVDDSPAIVETLSTFLTLEGYEVRQAFDGREALESVRVEPPDVIVLDLWMPVMDGRSFLRRLRALPSSTRDVPVVVITADPRALAESLSADAVIPKPFEIDSLLRVVNDVVH
ncbi:MAG: response regulator [Gemmatimonadota bacterium]